MSRSIKQAATIAAASVLAVTMAGCSLLPKEEAALKPPLVKPAQENYRTVKVERGTITKAVNGVGFLESVSMDMSQFTGQGGRLDKMEVKSGQQVKKGDVLVSLITDGLDLQVKEQELALERAKLAYKQARGGSADEERLARLQMEIEQIKYDRLYTQFNTKQLRSNIDGQVVFVEDLKQGDWVEPYQTLVTVADPTKLRISLNVSDPKDIQEVEVGMKAKITVNGTEMETQVVQTPSSAPDTPNKQLAEKYARTLYLELPEVPKDAKIGSSVTVLIVTQQKENVLMIPRSGVRAYLGRTFVRILEEGSRIREADIEQGIVSSTQVEIVTGVEEGQEIILQ